MADASARRPSQFGTFVHELRTRQQVTLRDFCEKHGFDKGNFSKLERGLLPPPQKREKLESYAKALGLEPGSDDWTEFFDRAYLDRDQLAREIIDDEEVLGLVPVLLRTVNNERLTAEQLQELIERIRRA